MSTVATGLLTAEEFWEWVTRPENQDKLYELDRGRVVEVPSPGELHGVIASLIARLLWNFAFRRGKGHVCGNDSGLLVTRDPDTVRGPDVMFFDEAGRLDDMSRKFVDRVPGLVVEVLSPTDQMTKVNRRLSQYLGRGVPLVWLVDPEVRSVTVYRPDKLHSVLDETDEVTGENVLPDLRLRVADLFALPGQ